MRPRRPNVTTRSCRAKPSAPAKSAGSGSVRVASRLQLHAPMMTRFDRTWEPLFVLIAFAIVFVRTL